MIPLLAGLIGLIWGAWLAAKRGGDRADMAQYAVGFALALMAASWIVLTVIALLV